MSFVVDSSEWSFDGWTTNQVTVSVERLLERVRIARERNETVWIGDDLQTRPVVDNLDLWSLSSPSAPIILAPELVQELAAWLGRAPRYLDEEVWPEGMTETLIQIADDGAKENPDLAWAHHHVKAGRAVACFSLDRSGIHLTTSSLGTVPVHWVLTEESHKAFWQAAIDLEGDNEVTLERLAPHAFPNLYFYFEVWHGLHQLGGGYNALRDEIKKYLRVLDAWGAWVFTFPPPALSPNDSAGNSVVGGLPTNQVIERRFLGFNLTFAPEKPNVYANAACRSAREIVIGTNPLYCEWHAKLELHRNRLHIHGPVPESGNKVIIAIVDEHLPLP